MRIIGFSSSLVVDPHKWTGITQYYVPCVFSLLEDFPKPTDGYQRESWMHGTFPQTFSISEFAVFSDTLRTVASSNFALWIWITGTDFIAVHVASESCWVGKVLVEM